ncbi:MAG TPA: hypothetical protein VFU22_22845 [Roseiflexaceae bacterium]|nr:hypothetical protein [Roseiflexaceae bacterium]
MNVLNAHKRLVTRPLPEVFNELAALGTAADRIWPEPNLPFRRTDGPMTVGVTRERHGAIRAVLETYEVNKRIVWQADLSFLRGTHTFEVQEVGGGLTLVRHVVRINVSWWFFPLWRFYVSGIHNRIMERLLDRLARGDVTMPGPDNKEVER